MSDDNRSESPLSSAAWGELRLGTRFVVRHQLAPGGTHRLTDVVGNVVSVTSQAVDIQTRRRGTVQVPRALVVAIKEIPPTPGRRGRPHQALSAEDLERLAVDGWAPRERQVLGSWILRSAGGYTGRANSALAVGHPDRPLGEALAAVTQWYSQREQPALIHVPLAPFSSPQSDPLVADAARHGWSWFQLTDVLTASAIEVARAGGADSHPAEGIRSVTSQTLSDAWWSLADDRMLEHADAALAVLTGSPVQEFLVAFVDDRPAARARISFAHGWGGISAVFTDPKFRRHGLAQHLLAESARVASERGIFSLYLQVSADNSQAGSMYQKLGFDQHHQYVYLRQT